MVEVTLEGKPINTKGELPAVGSSAPDFTLTNTELKEVKLADFLGKRIILNIYPSVDTKICAASTRQFDADIEKVENAVVLCVSNDTPFAHQRFCRAEVLTNVIPLSCFRHLEFGENYGVGMVDGPLSGLLSRAIVVIDEKGTVKYTEQVPEIGQEPNYEAALEALG